jgi:nicotinate-nucleotide adenylyltransferase
MSRGDVHGAPPTWIGWRNGSQAVVLHPSPAIWRAKLIACGDDRQCSYIGYADIPHCLHLTFLIGSFTLVMNFQTQVEDRALSEQSQRIGILGGTFDPVHRAHLMIAAVARQAAALDRVVLMPAGQPPHKESRTLSPAADRLAMARLAAAEGGFEVSDLEIATPGVDYTVDTLRALRALNPADRLYFIIGGDSLMMLDQWYRPDELLALAAFIAVYRPGNSLAELQAQRDRLVARFGGEVLLAEYPGMDISSTALRERAARGEDLSPWTPVAVAEYIREHNLYL